MIALMGMVYDVREAPLDRYKRCQISLGDTVVVDADSGWAEVDLEVIRGAARVLGALGIPVMGSSSIDNFAWDVPGYRWTDDDKLAKDLSDPDLKLEFDLYDVGEPLAP